jgi:hypothetical protein
MRMYKFEDGEVLPRCEVCVRLDETFRLSGRCGESWRYGRVDGDWWVVLCMCGLKLCLLDWFRKVQLGWSDVAGG